MQTTNLNKLYIGQVNSVKYYLLISSFNTGSIAIYNPVLGELVHASPDHINLFFAEMNRRSQERESPIPNDNPSTHDLVMLDMAERRVEGIRRYNTPLQGFNGLNSIQWMYEEMLDMVAYAKQALFEFEELKKVIAIVINSSSGAETLVAIAKLKVLYDQLNQKNQ